MRVLNNNFADIYLTEEDISLLQSQVERAKNDSKDKLLVRFNVRLPLKGFIDFYLDED